MISKGVPYDIMIVVLSHLIDVSTGENTKAKATNMELLRRMLWTSLVLDKSELGTIISWPSTLRKVVENNPKSLTNRYYNIMTHKR